jgi:hypothetical protein
MTHPIDFRRDNVIIHDNVLDWNCEYLLRSVNIRDLKWTGDQWDYWSDYYSRWYHLSPEACDDIKDQLGIINWQWRKCTMCRQWVHTYFSIIKEYTYPICSSETCLCAFEVIRTFKDSIPLVGVELNPGPSDTYTLITTWITGHVFTRTGITLVELQDAMRYHMFEEVPLSCMGYCQSFLIIIVPPAAPLVGVELNPGPTPIPGFENYSFSDSGYVVKNAKGQVISMCREDYKCKECKRTHDVSWIILSKDGQQYWRPWHVWYKMAIGSEAAQKWIKEYNGEYSMQVSHLCLDDVIE